MSQDPLIGKILKRRYRIRALLGRGGYGAVYLAQVDQRFVAVKVLDETLAHNAHEVKRFLDDYRVLYQLRHPHIAAVLDYGLDLGRYFIVMKYYSGGPLSNLLENHNRLHLITACRVISQVAAGLDAAHRVGVIHRDVKPQNVLLDQTGQVALTDFGIAKKLYDIQQQSGRTLPHQRLGSPYYMSPEQAQGYELGPTSDVYALGIMAFQMLTGWLPFDRGDDLATMHAQVYEPAPSIRAYDPNLPPETERVIAWALNKDPNARPQHASVFARSLTATVNVRQSQVMRPIQIPTDKRRSVSVPLITPPPISRTDFSGWLAAGIAAMVIVIGVVMLALNSSVLARPQPANMTLALTAKQGLTHNLAIWSGGSLTMLTPLGVNDTRPVWSPNGRQLAFVSDRADGHNHVYVMALDTQSAQVLAQSTAEDSGPSWSPTGQQIAFDSTRYGNSDIFVVNLDRTGLRRLTHAPSFEGDPAWSPKGDQIAFTTDRDGVYQIYVMDLDGNVQYRLTSGTRDNRRAAWSPTGAQLAFECEQPNGRLAICVINADATGQRTVISDAADNRQPAWSSDGQWLAYTRVVNQRSTVYVARSRDGGNALPLTGLSDDTQMPDWRPMQ